MIRLLLFTFVNIASIVALSSKSLGEYDALLSDDKPIAGSRLDLRIILVGENSCNFAFTKMNEISSIVAESIIIESEPISVKSITHYKLSGCTHHVGPAVLITIGIPTASVEQKGISCDSFYDMATASISASVDVIFRNFTRACGCELRLKSINLDLTDLEYIPSRSAGAVAPEALAAPQKSISKKKKKSNRKSQIKSQQRRKKVDKIKPKKKKKKMSFMRPRRSRQRGH
jgi:hypothetical protein